MTARRTGHFNVRPRYAAGSPAQVDEPTARQVARDERAFHGYVLDGMYGPARAADAAREGALRGIVELRIERPGGWEIHDLLTGERFVRPFDGPVGETPTRLHARLWRLRDRLRLPLEADLTTAARR